MFCGKCGFKCDDDAVFCTNCGEKVSSAQQPVSSAQPVGKGGDNRDRKVGIIAVAIAAIGIIIAMIRVVTMFGGWGYEEPVEKLFEVISKASSGVIDVETYLEMFPEKMIEDFMEEAGYSREEITDEIRSELQYEFGQFKDYKVSYEILSAEKVTGDELDDLKDDYEDVGVKVSAAKDVWILLKVEFRGNLEEETEKLRVIKVKNSWYIDISSLDGIL